MEGGLAVSRDVRVEEEGVVGAMELVRHQSAMVKFVAGFTKLSSCLATRGA